MDNMFSSFLIHGVEWLGVSHLIFGTQLCTTVSQLSAAAAAASQSNPFLEVIKSRGWRVGHVGEEQRNENQLNWVLIFVQFIGSN